MSTLDSLKRFWSDQRAAAIIKRVVNQWVALVDRLHSNQLKTTFYLPEVMGYRLRILKWIAQNCHYTATALTFIYSFSGNCLASAPISTFMCLLVIYIFPGSVHIFPPAEKADPSGEYMYNSLTDACRWKLGMRPRYFFPRNICFKFSAFCLCSTELQLVKDSYKLKGMVVETLLGRVQGNSI